mgnify:CR=1 FL=1
MQDRRYRPGDVLDDYCPRERRITDHAIVAMIDDEIRRTRCGICDAEHEYKEARIPSPRRKTQPPALFNQVLDGMDQGVEPVLEQVVAQEPEVPGMRLERHGAGRVAVDVLTHSEPAAANALGKKGLFVAFKPKNFDNVPAAARTSWASPSSGRHRAPSAARSYDDGEPGCAASLDGQHLRAAIVVQICGATFHVRVDTSRELQAGYVDLGGRADGRIGVVFQAERAARDRL